VAVAEACLAAASARRSTRPALDARDAALFGEAPAGSSSRVPREALARLGRAGSRSTSRHASAATRSTSAADLRWSLDELREAHRALAPLFP
jgi:hypothetical protein